MKHTKICYKFICLLLCLGMALSLAACGETRMVQSEVFAMDTVMTLTAYGKNAEAGLRAAEGVIQSMNDMLDPDLPTSTVYAINHAMGRDVVVSAQVAKMLSCAKTVYDRSGGALDLTTYPLSVLWGFVDQKYYKPTPEEISEALSRLCFDQLVLTSYPSSGSYSVSLPMYGELSFAATAKGCASDSAVDAMRQAGVTSGIVSLGGNVQTLGLKPDGSQWRVGIEDPNHSGTWLGVVNGGETAVVTSGSYQRYFPSGKTTYHHIINPSTGYPTTNNLLSVTVICEDGTMADCLSTAMFVLGESKALNYWRTYGGFDMILVTGDDRVVCTKGLIEEFTLSNDGYTLRFSE